MKDCPTEELVSPHATADIEVLETLCLPFNCSMLYTSLMLWTTWRRKKRKSHKCWLHGCIYVPYTCMCIQLKWTACIDHAWIEEAPRTESLGHVPSPLPDMTPPPPPPTEILLCSTFLKTGLKPRVYACIVAPG